MVFLLCPISEFDRNWKGKRWGRGGGSFKIIEWKWGWEVKNLFKKFNRIFVQILSLASNDGRQVHLITSVRKTVQYIKSEISLINISICLCLNHSNWLNCTNITSHHLGLLTGHYFLLNVGGGWYSWLTRPLEETHPPCSQENGHDKNESNYFEIHLALKKKKKKKKSQMPVTKFLSKKLRACTLLQQKWMTKDTLFLFCFVFLKQLENLKEN